MQYICRLRRILKKKIIIIPNYGLPYQNFVEVNKINIVKEEKIVQQNMSNTPKVHPTLAMIELLWSWGIIEI